MQFVLAWPGEIYTKLQQGMRVDAALMLLSGSCFPDRASATTATAPLWAVQDDAVPAGPVLDLPKTASATPGAAAVGHQPEAKHEMVQSLAAPAHQEGSAQTSWMQNGAAQRSAEGTEVSQKTSSSHPSELSKAKSGHPLSRNSVNGVDALKEEIQDAAQIHLPPWSDSRQQAAWHPQSASDADRQSNRRRSQSPTDASRKPVPT